GVGLALRDLLAVGVAIHQRLVLGLLDDALDQLGAGLVEPVALGFRYFADGGPLAVGVVQQTLRDQADQRLRAGRQIQRLDAVPERRLACGQLALGIRSRVVEPGNDHRARHTDLRALVPQRRR